MRIENEGICKKWIHYITAQSQVSLLHQSELKNMYFSANGTEKNMVVLSHPSPGWLETTPFYFFISSKYCNRIFSRIRRDEGGQELFFKIQFPAVSLTVNEIFRNNAEGGSKSPRVTVIIEKFGGRSEQRYTLYFIEANGELDRPFGRK